ncbi:HEAT repeat-containing protein [Gracilibacillus ureilyticus]|uniref:HEAT repeat-containing protein n=1 Tax=Gracilibacillus ureilyticus TaxID=531814 RepID=A0A1H9N8F3_9BACI|nr:conserved virulence factor C family protein [Gracilibacillus ureilyticus]SER32091.1 HEAT repeat-containing protein [Gracilibacillus ureilyticus]
MKILSIEPTPSPYSMKLNLDEKLPDNWTENYKANDDLNSAPAYIKELFQINGVKGIYRVIDFIALERNPKVSWEEILPEVTTILGTDASFESTFYTTTEKADDSFGEINVFIQMFRFIPMQIKLVEGEHEKRVGLPANFTEAALKASENTENMLEERRWIEQSPRYGDIDQIAEEITEELSASYDNKRLQELVDFALTNRHKDHQFTRQRVTMEMLENPNWKARYAALDRMSPTIKDLDLLDKALEDEKASIRRLATAYLGMIENERVLPYLYKALKDNAVNVRRTAGDCLSDLGFKQAMPKMIESLKDENRLVRWRAAMFLYELGDETAIPALNAAIDDPEFEVRMQAKMALARIEGGEKAKGSIWHQMTKATEYR